MSKNLQNAQKTLFNALQKLLWKQEEYCVTSIFLLYHKKSILSRNIFLILYHVVLTAGKFLCANMSRADGRGKSKG